MQPDQIAVRFAFTVTKYNKSVLEVYFDKNIRKY